uniref:Uncharacterized protein n=1 Tax=Rhizophora mucronata TaxID=61149 RepID=A0A2P2MYD6_RHIMU
MHHLFCRDHLGHLQLLSPYIGWLFFLVQWEWGIPTVFIWAHPPVATFLLAKGERQFQSIYSCTLATLFGLTADELCKLRDTTCF